MLLMICYLLPLQDFVILILFLEVAQCKLPSLPVSEPGSPGAA